MKNKDWNLAITNHPGVFLKYHRTSLLRWVYVKYLQTKLLVMAKNSDDSAMLRMMANVCCTQLCRITFEHSPNFEVSYDERRLFGKSLVATDSQFAPHYGESKLRHRNINQAIKLANMYTSGENVPFSLMSLRAHVASFYDITTTDSRRTFEALPFAEKQKIAKCIDTYLIETVKFCIRRESVLAQARPTPVID